MGGTVIVLATLIAYFLAKLLIAKTPTASGLLVLFLMAGLGMVGFVDDFIKIFKQRWVRRDEVTMTPPAPAAPLSGIGARSPHVVLRRAILPATSNRVDSKAHYMLDRTHRADVA